MVMVQKDCLTPKMVDIIEQVTSKVSGKQKKKKQIILSHTSRDIEEYLSMIKHRNDGKYDRIPHFIISKDGHVIQKLALESYSNYFDEPNINRNSIIIVLENLGWLEKVPLKDYYTNWIGNIYKREPYQRKWRDYFFWEPYTTKQVQTAAELCINIVNEHKIEKKCVGHNTTIKDIDRTSGIVSRSNFDKSFTDMSPAFNFEKFTNYIKDEQFV
jgi:N-acetyl-anhydromuramyl-L-alanine amidase AmpD